MKNVLSVFAGLTVAMASLSAQAGPLSDADSYFIKLQCVDKDAQEVYKVELHKYPRLTRLGPFQGKGLDNTVQVVVLKVPGAVEWIAGDFDVKPAQEKTRLAGYDFVNASIDVSSMAGVGYTSIGLSLVMRPDFDGKLNAGAFGTVTLNDVEDDIRPLDCALQ